MITASRPRMNESIYIILEPTAACNLRCKHCYHAKTGYANHKMSMQTLDRFLAVCAPHYKNVKIIWHGGEPLLMGCDFFREAYEHFARYSQNCGVRFDFSVQTNGTLLDEKLIDVFAKNDTYIALSYDGTFNDVLRRETGKVEDVICLLQSKKVPFSCLSTVSSLSVDHLVELYTYFKGRKIPIKFNPILPDGAAKRHNEYMLTKEQWADNEIRLLDVWLYDKDCNIHVATCCDALQRFLGGGYGCLNGTCMFRYLAIDSYGNIYPCGRLMENKYKLADIHGVEDLHQVFLRERYIALLEQNRQRIESCKACRYFSRCHGGCNASSSLGGDIAKRFEFECYATKHIFSYLEKALCACDKDKLNPYAKEIMEEHEKESVM